MRRDQLLKHSIIIGLVILVIQFCAAGLLPGIALAGDGGDPPCPTPDTTGTSNGVVTDTTGTGGTYSIAPEGISYLDVFNVLVNIVL
jgi:hypothetical protein